MINYISIKEVLDNILAHPLLQDVSLERAVNYTQQFMRIVGMPNMFIEKTEELKIEDYRAQLPCDFYQMIQVRTLVQHCDTQSEQVFVYSTDDFHMSSYKQDSGFCYKLQGNCIFTSIKEGTIEISYRAIATDDEGFPLVPDNAAFIRALELYIKKQAFTILFDMQKINANVYQNVQQEYAWAVGQAQSSLVMPSIDQMQTFTNSWNTLVSRATEHSRGFRTNSIQEKIRRH